MTLITGNDIKDALLNAHACLINEKDKIDALNVFPVPDGDTGTNMLLTYSSGIEAIRNLEDASVADVSKAFSKGLLMGARGNSGVILSQIFRGMSKYFDGKTKITANDFAKSLVDGRNVAYKAVMNPVEGTILTVISDMSKDVYKLRDQNDVIEMLNTIVKIGEESLNYTPELLPVLKEAGVVDSGGYGLMVIFKGIRDYFTGEITAPVEGVKVLDTANVAGESTEFGYCTEFIVEVDEAKALQNNFSEELIKQQLTKIGDSLVVVHDDDILKVHVHTLLPGEALNIGQKYGEFLKLKIENMTLQHEEIINESSSGSRQKYAVIAVSPGEGISKQFSELAATHIIDGGQTMNPSTNDFVSIIKKANAENIIILPNNSNIIMAANQTKELIEESTDMKVEVIPTKSIIQGMVSLSFFNGDIDIEENVAEMIDAYEEVKYGEVTYAVRDTTMNDVEIKSGEYISIFDKNIISSTPNKIDSLLKLIEAMIDEESSVISLVYGKDVNQEEIDTVVEKLEDLYSDCDLELCAGQQDVYSYFVGVE